MITARTAIAGIAAIVVLVFAGAGAGTLFSSNSSTLASASARGSSCPVARGPHNRLTICQIRESLAPLRGAIGTLQRRLQMRGGVASWVSAMRRRCAANKTTASLFAPQMPRAGGAVAPVVAELFGGRAKLKPGGPQMQIKLCATPAPMNRRPRAGSPGRGWAPPTSSSQRRG